MLYVSGHILQQIKSGGSLQVIFFCYYLFLFLFWGVGWGEQVVANRTHCFPVHENQCTLQICNQYPISFRLLGITEVLKLLDIFSVQPKKRVPDFQMTIKIARYMSPWELVPRKPS